MTVRKIKNIRQLQREKKQLHQRERELTQQIRSGWKDLKKLLNPCSIVERHQRKYKADQNVREDHGIFKNVLSFATTLIIQKLMKKAGQFFD